MRRCLLALALACVVPPTASAAVPNLAGDTLLSGPSSVWAPVEVPADTRITLFEEGKLKAAANVQGAGDIRAVYLVREPVGPDSPGLYGRSFFEGRFSLYPAGSAELEVSDEGYTAATVLPAGRYRLFALAGPGPVEAQLTVPELPGLAALTPAERLAPQAPAATRWDGLPVTNLAVIGTVATLPGPGFIASDFFVEDPSELAGGAGARSEFCTYPPGTDPEAPEAFSIGCPGGESFEFLAPLSSGVGQGFTSVAAEAGKWGLGGNVQFAGAPPVLTSASLFVPYAGTALPQPAGSAPPPETAPPSLAPLPALSLSGATARRDGRITVRIICRSPLPCRGTIRALAGSRAVGHRDFSVAAGKAAAIAFRARVRGLRRVTLRATGRGGLRASRTVRVRR